VCESAVKTLENPHRSAAKVMTLRNKYLVVPLRVGVFDLVERQVNFENPFMCCRLS